MTSVRFSVVAETSENEHICLTGNLSELGEWNPDCVVPLQKTHSNGLVNSCTWSIEVTLTPHQDIHYRYCVAEFQETVTGEPQRVIKKWETNITPRTFTIRGKDSVDGQNIPVEKFGDYDGYQNVTRSWLSKQTHIQLRLTENPIHMYKKQYEQQIYSIKCIPKDYRVHKTSTNMTSSSTTSIPMDEDSTEGPQTCPATEILISVLREGLSVACGQKQFGEIYQHNDYMIFRTDTLYPESLGFQLEFYVHDKPDGSTVPRYVGYTHILPLKIKHTLGEKHIPILGFKHRPIGEVTVKHMIAKPVPGLNFNMECSYQSHWKHMGVSLDVGHRGMGSSYKKLALVRENTTASLQAAGENGADLVEFDVMLTKDLHTVIYHDFTVCVASKRKSVDSSTELLPIAVKDLTLEQLQSMKLSHISSTLGKHIDVNDLDPSDVQPFPTLKQCFIGVDEHVGFNIEIKYPLQDVEGVWEMTGFMDHNTYIDILLQAVFDGAGSRRIIFSSFDAESCILLQRKQNKYPVLFLTNGPTERYTPYMDPRAQGYDVAIHFAKAEGILGVDLLSEMLLKDLSVIKRVLDHGLVLFVWGDDNNSRDNISLLRKHGVHGIIYDRIDFYKPEKGKYFEVEKNVLDSIKSIHSEEPMSTSNGASSSSMNGNS